MFICIQQINLDLNRSAEPIWEPASTTDERALYVEMSARFGACKGSVWLPTRWAPEPVKVGWVFRKQVKFDDCDLFYTREVTVTCYVDKPTSGGYAEPYHLGVGHDYGRPAESGRAAITIDILPAESA